MEMGKVGSGKFGSGKTLKDKNPDKRTEESEIESKNYPWGAGAKSRLRPVSLRISSP